MVSLKLFSLIILLIYLQMEIEASKKSGSKSKDCGCGEPEYVTRLGANIMRGQPVYNYAQYPWMAAIYLPKCPYNWGNCGGSIISPTFILTAAHCVFRYENLFTNETKNCITEMKSECFVSPKEIKVGILGKYRTKPGKKLEVKRVIVYTGFKIEPLSYDIALLELKEPIKCSSHNKPICVPKEDFVRHGEYISIAGFGKRKIENTDASKFLLEGSLNRIHNTACQKENPDIMCIKGEQTSSCEGDSGAPGFANKKGVFYAVGVTSRSFCNTSELSYFTKVPYYYDFIKRHVYNLPKPRQQ